MTKDGINFTCNICQETKSFNYIEYLDESYIPQGWVTLFVSSLNKTVHVCPNCLADILDFWSLQLRG